MTSNTAQVRFAEARESLVENQLRPEGIIDAALLAAIGAVERERFVPQNVIALAYSDRAIPLGNGRELMPAASLAQLIQELAPAPGERAMVVGAGSGYSTAVLSHMGVSVTGVENDPTLTAIARSNGIELVETSLEAGNKSGAPYDFILIDGAVEEVPEAIISQLREGGRLATGLVDRGVSRLAVGTRIGGVFGIRVFSDAAVPLLPGFARAPSFVF